MTPAQTTTERTGLMDRFNALGRGAQLMLVAGVLLLIDLFLPWQDFGISDELGIDVDDSFSGWRGFAGVVLGLLTIVLLAWLVVRLFAVDIPLPVSQAMSAALLGVLIAAFGIIKFLTILGDEQTIWAWIGLLLSILVAVGAYLQVQEAGGVETLRSEIPRSTSYGAGSTTTTTPPPPPAPTEPGASGSAPPPVEPTPPPESNLDPDAPRDTEDRRDA
jgi:hypothetical protein